MALEVWYANPRDCSSFLHHLPGDGRDGNYGDGRGASRQVVQLEMERRAEAGEAIAMYLLLAIVGQELYRLQDP